MIAIPTVGIGIIIFFLRRFCFRTSRSIKRMEGVTKSPVFNQLSSSLNGLTTIRAFKAEELMVEEFHYIQNIHTSAFFTFISTDRWFAIHLDWIIVFYILICVLSFLIMPEGKAFF